MGEMDRILFLDYFPQLLGDKMSREPRLSALSLLRDHAKSSELISRYFSTKEWDYYQKLLTKDDSLLTSSMGRLIDGVAALIGICPLNTYEGQAAMELEALARKYSDELKEFYPLPIRYNRIDWRIMLEEMISDLSGNAEKYFIAKKFFLSLVRLMEQVSDIFDINDLAFSGGVFQNALLTEMITEQFSVNKRVHFHQELSPNDECIALGQLAMHEINNMGIVEHSALFQKSGLITH
jgi:hydrogenase maturation protein HypF